MPTVTLANPGTNVAQSMQFGPDGRIAGIDGVLNQITEAVARQAGPMIRDQVLPALQADKALQQTMGAAAGREIAKQLKPVLWVGAFALAVIAGTGVYKAHRASR